MLSDADRIRNLLGAYCERIDAADFAGVGELFAAGALADPSGTVLARGAVEVEAFFRRTVRLHDGSPRTKHLVFDSVFEEQGTGDGEPDADAAPAPREVVVRSSFVVLQASEAGGIDPIIAGRYVDRIARPVDRAWHFAERRFVVDLTGDLTRHLAGGP